MHEWASAPARRLAPQDIRTFFVSTSTWGRRTLFQTQAKCDLMMDVLLTNRALGRFALHEFVIMREHIHLLLTPAVDVSLEKAVQYIKGGFSFRAKREQGFHGEIWQPGLNEHRIKDAEDYANHVAYIHENPVKARLAATAKEYRYSSASGLWELDPAPAHLGGGRETGAKAYKSTGG